MLTGGGFKISRLTAPADLRAAARLLASCDPWLRLGIGYKSCLRNIKTPYRELYGAKAPGGLKGLVIVAMCGAFKGYVQALCVAPEARGRGAGKSLMRYAERRIAKDSPNVFLCVSSFNKAARRFYRRLGYSRVGLLRDFLLKGSDEILMRKSSGPLLAHGAAGREKGKT